MEGQEFFASRHPQIANAPNAAARKRLIKQLPQTNPVLWEEYRRALYNAESASRFLRDERRRFSLSPQEIARLNPNTRTLPVFRTRQDAELDTYYARLYGLTRKQLRYLLDPADLTEKELEDILDPWEEVRDPLDPAGYAERAAQSTFLGETFRVLKEKEMRQYGEYRTRWLVLQAWEYLTERSK